MAQLSPVPPIPEEILRVHGGKIRLEFYRGLKGIAVFLKCDSRTVQNMIREGKLPIKREPGGAYVLCNLDYYLCLEFVTHGHC